MNRPAFAILLVATFLSSPGCSSDPDLREISAAELLASADRAYAERDGRESSDLHLYLAESLRRNPRDPEALWRKIRLLAYLGRFEEAWESGGAALVARRWENAEVWVWAGYAGAEALAARERSLALADLSSVLATLERALELAPDDARVHLGLGILSLAMAGDSQTPPGFALPDPVVHLMTARELRPGLPRTHLVLARAYLERRDPRRAREALLALLASPPETREGPHFPDAQIAEWLAAREEAARLVLLLPGSWRPQPSRHSKFSLAGSPWRGES